MELTVNRYKSDKETTLGKLFMDGLLFCYTCEDQFQAVKVKEETRIPAGKYQIKLLTTGNHHIQYAKRFPDMHKGMLWLQNVPKFQGILIHIGNTEKDTAGCLLIGDTVDETKMSIGNSTSAYRRFYPLVLAELEAGNEVWIEYKDLDRAA